VSAAQWRGPAIAAAVVVVLVVLAVLLGAATPGPRGPASSSYASQPRGVAAWASLLERSGHPVTRLRRRLDDATLDRRATLVVLDPESIADAEIAALRRFLLDGGSAVLGGASGQDWVREALVGVPRLSGAGDRGAVALAPVAQTRGVTALAAAGDAAYATGGRLLPVAGGRRGPLALAGGSAGRVTVLADASPLQNRLLGRADNAAFALALAGGARRPVVFSEFHHGYGPTGLAALPTRWKVALVLAGLAALALMVSRGRRLGPAEAPARELPPPRRAYVDALADALARTRRPGDAAAPVRARARRAVAARAGLPADAPDPDVRAAALRLGLDDEQADAVLGSGSPVAAGAALARLQGGER
jgi:Domain of unknown function (DUF4350)